MKELPINICPLLAIARIGSPSGPATCIEDDCAWWDYGDNACAMLSIAESLSAVTDKLEGGADGG